MCFKSFSASCVLWSVGDADGINDFKIHFYRIGFLNISCFIKYFFRNIDDRYDFQIGCEQSIERNPEILM